MIYIDETEPETGKFQWRGLGCYQVGFIFPLLRQPEIEPTFKPRNVKVKRTEPTTEYQLGEELGRYVKLVWPASDINPALFR